MLTHLRIKNFKAWQDTGDIRLAPLTVFFGTNSSGKSSISQFLLMLKQTAQSADRKRVLVPSDRDMPIDLGTYLDMVHGHDKPEHISFELGWNLAKEMQLKDVVHSGDVFSGRTMRFEAALALAGGKRQDVVVHRMCYQLGSLPEKGLELGMKLKTLKSPGKDKYELVNSGYNPVRKEGRVWPLPSPVHFYGFPAEVMAYYQNAGFVGDLAFALEQRLQLMSYLGPLRDYPRRQYTYMGETPEDVGWQGKQSIPAILAARERFIRPGKYKPRKSFQVLIASWLEKMGLIESFDVKPIVPDGRLYEVVVKTPMTEAHVNLTDVGFGVSQVLPVLVQCFYAPPGSIIIMEQPELHLHPSVQASLADLFIEAIQARENGKDRNIQLLIESHSEHFLIRLQRRIAEEKISREKVAIHFCKPTSSGAKMESLELDLFGNITNWPEDFFGDRFVDLAEMTRAAATRRMGEER
ncbi:MAG TPA: DUF3696 domain-containing protein [bacterium]|nr:DUF3696 domain-containing protein [bacterium]